MRTLKRTNEFDEFYNSVGTKVQEKIDYALTLISQMKVVSTKFVKKLEGTEFYEMRISVEMNTGSSFLQWTMTISLKRMTYFS